jgi:hypothetical protein
VDGLPGDARTGRHDLQGQLAIVGQLLPGGLEDRIAIAY